MSNNMMQDMVMPGYTADQRQLERRMAIANALRQQSMAPENDGQTQVINGWAIPNSSIGMLAKALGKGIQGYAANKMDQETDLARRDLAEKYGEGIRAMVGGGTKNPDIASSVGLSQGAMQGDIGPTNTNANRMNTVLAQGAGSSTDEGFGPIGMPINQRMMAMMLDPSAYTSATLNNYEQTPEQKNWRAQGINAPEMKPYTVAKAKKEGIIELQPGTTALDLSNGQERFQPKVGEGITLNNGVANPLPGYANANAQIVGAQTAAQEANKILPNVTLASGAQVPMWAGQAVGGAVNPGMSTQAVQQRLQTLSQITDPQERQSFLNAWNNELRGNQVGQSTAQKVYQDQATGKAVNYEDSLNNRVQNGSDLMARIGESRNALQNFKVGGGGETRAQLASYAQAMGMPDSMVSAVAGGNLGAMQEFKKLAIQQSMESLKQAISAGGGTGGSRITQAEFKIFQDANPNLSTDPRAIDKIYDFATRLYNRDYSEQQAFNQYKQTGHPLDQWQAEWQRHLNQTGDTSGQPRTQPNNGGWAIQRVQ